MDRDCTDPTDSDGESERTARVKRRDVLASGAALTTATIAGCLGGDGGNGTAIGIISSNAGFGDRAFNDLALEGLERAQEEEDFELNQIEETDIAAYGDTQATAAETNDMVVLVGFQHTEPLTDNATEFSDTNWMLINDNIEEPNVAGYAWANHEMSYLAGVQAGTMTNVGLENNGNSNNPDENHIGFVGGVEGSLIRAFQRAYEAGAQSVNSDVEISIGYAGSFSDPAAGEQVAASQYQDGADIIYHASAGTGPGIFDAAQAANKLAIGVDADQSVTLDQYSDVIIGSAVKFIDEGTYDAALAEVNDNWESVQGNNVLGLEQEAVDLIIGQGFEDQMPQELTDNVEQAKQNIIDGTTEVPCSHDGC